MCARVCVPVLQIHLWSLDRGGTTPGSSHRTTGTEGGDEDLNACLGTHTTEGETAEEEDGAADGDVPLLAVTSHPSLETVIVTGGHTGGGVETFTFQASIDLHVVTKVQQGREGVGEVENEQGANHGNKTVQVGDGGGNNEGEDPVHRTKSIPY